MSCIDSATRSPTGDANCQVYVGSESTIYRIIRKMSLLNQCGRSRSPGQPREPPVIKATGIQQGLAWDITLLPAPVKSEFNYL
jgi:putative transposase